MNRGVLYWVNFEPSSPPEFAKLRPALLISNSEQNSILPSVVVLPVSSKAPEVWPLRIKITLPQGKKSYVVIPGIRQIAKSRLVRKIGELSADSLNTISEALRAYLDD